MQIIIMQIIIMRMKYWLLIGGGKQRQIMLLQSVNKGVETPHSLAACGSLFNVYKLEWKLARCILKGGRCLRRTRCFFQPHFDAVNLRHNEVLVGDSAPVCCCVSR